MNILGKIYSSIIKKTYGKFNGKLFAFAAYFGCFFACAYLFFIKTKKQIIIAPATAIGDNIYILSFWDNLNKWAEKSDKEILFFISDRYKEILQTYNPPNNKVTVIYLKHCGFKHLFLFTLWLLFKHPHLANFSLKHSIFCPVPSAYKSHIDKLNLVGCRNQLSRILNIPLEPISYHKQALAPINCIENFKEHHNRICVINPYSYSMYSNVQLFEKFVIELKKRGYIIYTNVIQNQRAIEGTLRLDCCMQELYSIACEIPLIISIRTGLLDYLIPSGINMFVLYGQTKVGDGGHENDYTLQEWKPEGKLCEVWTSQKSDDEIVQKFQEFLNNIEYEDKQ